jgi:hypothetical protein
MREPYLKVPHFFEVGAEELSNEVKVLAQNNAKQWLDLPLFQRKQLH